MALSEEENMTIVIRGNEGVIKTFMESASGYVPEPGETLEEVNLPFAEYARRLRLSVDGHSGETIRIPAGVGFVNVRVECPGEAAVSLMVHGEIQVVELEDGVGGLAVPRDAPGRFVITPADRVTYCAAGEAVSVVEVAG
jgi:hypothetical protein